MSVFELGDPDVRFKDHEVAFAEAIKAGRLTEGPGPACADDYMYMGTWDGVDKFKHVLTREYLP